jgi:hypothetical protein
LAQSCFDNGLAVGVVGADRHLHAVFGCNKDELDFAAGVRTGHLYFI